MPSEFGHQISVLGLIRQTTGSAVEALVRAPGGQVVAQRSASDKQFYLTDQLGSTLALVSDTCAQVRSLRYDPDGNQTTNTGTGPAALITWAQGQSINGQYHFGARYYDPNTATWTQQDPLNQITDLQQANRYTYAGGDPVNQVDPQGLWFGSHLLHKVVEGVCITAVGGIGGAAAVAAAPSVAGSAAAGAATAAGIYACTEEDPD